MDIDGNGGPAGGREPEPPQIKVLFTTTDASLELPEPKRQLLVPAGMSPPHASILP